MAARVPFFLLFFSANCIAFGTDITGIWTGQADGPNPEKSEKEDVSFQFKAVNKILTGVRFGEEFDLPVEDLKVEGDSIRFSLVSTNYYGGSRQTMVYTGTIGASEIQLTCKRKDAPASPSKKDKKNDSQTLTLTRVTRKS